MRMSERFKKTPNFKEEERFWRRGFKFIVGLDEAGRGALAGPVVAGAIRVNFLSKAFISQIKNKSLSFPKICDSKKLSESQREKCFDFLTNHPAIEWGVGIISEKIIDQINIWQATKLAMKQAIANLSQEADFLLIDGKFLLDDLPLDQKAMPLADEKIWSCAAASIIAKVTRDRLMKNYHQRFPEYGFSQNKGYGTPAHFLALKKHGASPIHRLSFSPLKNNFSF